MIKQEAWMIWAKKPDDTLVKAQSQQLKIQSRLDAEKAREAWLEPKVEEPDETVVRHRKVDPCRKILSSCSLGRSSERVQPC